MADRNTEYDTAKREERLMSASAETLERERQAIQRSAESRAVREITGLPADGDKETINWRTETFNRTLERRPEIEVPSIDSTALYKDAAEKASRRYQTAEESYRSQVNAAYREAALDSVGYNNPTLDQKERKQIAKRLEDKEWEISGVGTPQSRSWAMAAQEMKTEQARETSQDRKPAAQMSEKELIAEARQLHAQFKQLWECYQEAPQSQRPEIQREMQPIVNREQEVRQEYTGRINPELARDSVPEPQVSYGY